MGWADEASGSIIPGHSFSKSYNHLPEIKERGTDPSLHEIIFSFPISDELDRSNPASCGRSCIRSVCLPGEQRRHPDAVLSAGEFFTPLPGQTMHPTWTFAHCAPPPFLPPRADFLWATSDPAHGSPFLQQELRFGYYWYGDRPHAVPLLQKGIQNTLILFNGFF